MSRIDEIWTSCESLDKEELEELLNKILKKAQVETPNVNNNEGKKEVCKYNKDGNCMFTEYCCNEYIGTCMV